MFGSLSEIIRFLDSIQSDMAWWCVFALGLMAFVLLSWFVIGRFRGLTRVVVFLSLCAYWTYRGGSKTNGVDGLSAPMNTMSIPGLSLSVGDVETDHEADYRISSIAVNSNDVSLALSRLEEDSDETRYFELCATTNLSSRQCWQSIAYCPFPSGSTNLSMTLSRGLLGGYGISNLCCFTFIESGDDDGDGLDNWFERLVHRTDPYNADSDMKDVAFFYTCRLYEKIIEKGNLK